MRREASHQRSVKIKNVDITQAGAGRVIVFRGVLLGKGDDEFVLKRADVKRGEPQRGQVRVAKRTLEGKTGVIHFDYIGMKIGHIKCRAVGSQPDGQPLVNRADGGIVNNKDGVGAAGTVPGRDGPVLGGNEDFRRFAVRTGANEKILGWIQYHTVRRSRPGASGWRRQKNRFMRGRPGAGRVGR